MAKSSAKYFEVRWRVSGTDEAWSAPQRVDPSKEIVVEGLDRTKTYEFEARAVSACGAKSDWAASVNHTVPDAPAGTLTLADLKNETDQAATDAAAANAELANIASDNMLTAGEKPTVIRDYNVILTEQPGIDAQATAYGITTEKVAYDAKITALVNYLNTLASPTDWDDISGNTTIVGADFRQAFADVYTSRQALLNAIYAAAKAKAAAAQAAAAAAQETADKASANILMKVVNPRFESDTSGWTFANNSGAAGGGEFYRESGAHGFPGLGTYLVHQGQSGQAWAVARNAAFTVSEGQPVIAQADFKDSAAAVNDGTIPGGAWSSNAGAFGCVGIEWLDGTSALLSRSLGSPTAGHGGTYAQCVSRVSALAPTGAKMARVVLWFANHTSGYINASAVSVQSGVADADEVAESNGRKWAAESGADVTAGKSVDVLTDGQSFRRAPISSWSPEIVENANFLSPADPLGNIPGWADVNGTLSIVPAGGPKGLKVVLQFSGVGGAYESNMHACKPGEVVSASVTCSVISQNSGAYPRLKIQCFDASGTELAATGNRDVQVNTAVNTTQTANAMATMPVGAVSFRIFVYVNATTSYGFLIIDPRISVNDVRVSGSGARLGDMRNQVMVGVGNYGAGWSGGGISYSASSTSATISVAATTLRIGSAALAYNASSTTVSGSAGVTRTYYLYYDDDGYTGGSKTLNATTSLITSMSADGRVLVGTVPVTFPTSGTGSGSGGTSCPDENAWVLRADPEGLRSDWCVRAREVEVGHYLRLSDGRAGRVTYSERKASPRVRVVNSEGRVLTCSPTAPLELSASAFGDCVLARSSLGAFVRYRCPAPVLATQIDSVEDAGDGYVQHITCENACFWTGDDPDHLFSHHNLKPTNP